MLSFFENGQSGAQNVIDVLMTVTLLAVVLAVMYGAVFSMLLLVDGSDTRGPSKYSQHIVTCVLVLAFSTVPALLTWLIREEDFSGFGVAFACYTLVGGMFAYEARQKA